MGADPNASPVPGGLPGAVAAHAARQPDKVAVVDPVAGRVTYHRLRLEAERAAAGLARLGVGPGDPVLVQMPNWYQLVVLHLAISSLGALTAPLPPSYRRHELAHLARLTGTAHLVVPAAFRGFDHVAMAQELLAEAPGLRHVVVAGEARLPAAGFLPFAELLGPAAGAAPDWPPAGCCKPDDVAVLLSTSGTTGEPKAVMWQTKTVRQTNLNVGGRYGLSSEDVVYMPTPIAHASGLVHGVWLALSLGATLVLQDSWNAREAVLLCAREGCTFSCVAPAMLQDILRAPELEEARRLPAFRVLLTAGAGEQLLREAGAALPHCLVGSCYGGTEFGTPSACPPGASLDRRASTDGTVFPTTPVRVVGPSGEELPPGVEGELCVGGPAPLGYLGEDAAARGDGRWNGFVRTGDLGWVDAEGYLKVTGRLKALIRRGSVNVGPLEVEKLLSGHPKIAMAAVLGLPDPRLGERVCACVVLRPGQTLTLEEVQDWMRRVGADKHKWPEVLHVFDEFPLSAFGRVQKFVLLEKIAKRSAPPA